MVAKSKSRSKAPVANETSASIAEQTAEFLKDGGEITHIDNGVSGQQNVSGPRHITLGSSKPKAS